MANPGPMELPMTPEIAGAIATFVVAVIIPLGGVLLLTILDTGE